MFVCVEVMRALQIRVGCLVPDFKPFLWECLRRGPRRNLYLYFLHLQYWRSDWIYRKSALNYDDLTVSIEGAYYH